MLNNDLLLSASGKRNFIYFKFKKDAGQYAYNAWVPDGPTQLEAIKGKFLVTTGYSGPKNTFEFSWDNLIEAIVEDSGVNDSFEVKFDIDGKGGYAWSPVYMHVHSQGYGNNGTSYNEKRYSSKYVQGETPYFTLSMSANVSDAIVARYVKDYGTTSVYLGPSPTPPSWL